MGAPADVTAGPGRGLRGAGSQDAQADAEGERSLLGHPRQLPAADHPDDREPLGRGRPDPGSGAGLGTVRHGQNTIGSRSALSWARVGSGRVGAPMSTSTPEPASGARRPGPARPGRRVGPDLQLRAPADPQLHPRAVDPARLHHLDGQQPEHRAVLRHGPGPLLAGARPRSSTRSSTSSSSASCCNTSKGIDNYVGLPGGRRLHLHLHPACRHRRAPRRSRTTAR